MNRYSTASRQFWRRDRRQRRNGIGLGKIPVNVHSSPIPARYRTDARRRRRCPASPFPAQNHSNTFDYVVVGAGSSGCVIANRLSADPHTRVLLIEAGGPDVHPLIPVPGKWTSLIGTRDRLELLDGAGSRVSDGRSLRWPRGRTYGGSSALNAMAYVRGHQLCFDAWAEAAGASWAYREVLPYFMRAEDNSRGAIGLSRRRRSAGRLGHDRSARRPPGVSRGGARDRVRRPAGLGFQRSAAGTGRRLLPEEHPQRARRHSAAAAFLTPVLSRPNLVGVARQPAAATDDDRPAGVRRRSRRARGMSSA